MIRRESGSIDQVMRALQELEETVTGAQLRLGNQCVVSRPFLLQRMETIARCMPDALSQATKLIEQEKDILEAARREAAEQIKKARDDAQKILDDAKKQAAELQTSARKASDEAQKAAREAKNHTEAERAKADREVAALRQQAQNEMNAARQQAQQVYDNMVNKAQFDAGNIVQQAQAAAQAAVSTDNVHRMAVVAAQEMQDAATRETAILRQNGVEYVNDLLRDADSYLCSLVEDLRRQRQALDERR